jgi:glutamate-ammonia-ligase adenylyltransferase
MSLADFLRPCGPLVDAAAAERLFEVLSKAAERDGWSARLKQVWPSLEPIAGASPYLAGLMRRAPGQLRQALEAEDPIADILRQTQAVADETDLIAGAKTLRALKADAHLTIALADLGGVWDLSAVTGNITEFADLAVQSALAMAVRTEVTKGRLLPAPNGAAGPIPGLFCIAMGKHGAFELNYSSDIDISIFYEPDQMLVPPGGDAQAVALAVTRSLAQLLQERTAEGYVFRVDLRLRPDPSSTPPAVSVAAALDYYQTVGQNWERAAFIKARAMAGDVPLGQTFLSELSGFIWRKNLDFAAIADIHSIKRQIHIHKVDDRLTAKGANLKLGRGGIREIEFYVQTQQLILGGRNPALRSNRTLDALTALCVAGQVTAETAAELHRAYLHLRGWEHRVQMLHDEQTHRLPESDADRRRVAALSGAPDLRRFDAQVTRLLKQVNQHYGELFPDGEDLSSSFGSLVFTGVEDDPETLATLARMGFSNPPQVAATIRSWHHGHINATRTERGRELFTQLAPRLLDATNATGAPDAAFLRFGDFFSRLSSGVQLQSLMLAQPKLLKLLVQVMAFAPRLAATLARRPAALDALLDHSFFEPFDVDAEAQAFASVMARAEGFEAAMDAARVMHREQAFRIGLQVMSGAASAEEAGRAFAGLANMVIGSLAPVALAETVRIGGDFPGQVAVVALGKCGSGEMTARSDLDLMTLYQADDPVSMSGKKGWGAETFYARFTQRLVAALSAPTGEGGLYEVDLQLRPSGTAGPVAVSRAAFDGYYAGQSDGEAETWEILALTRARVVWASSPEFAVVASAAIEAALRRPRNPKQAVRDMLDMRRLMEEERPAKGDWDLKLAKGGLVDIEFIAQLLQIIHGPHGGPLEVNTAKALAMAKDQGLAKADQIAALEAGWKLQQNLTQLLKVALDDDADPLLEPAPFRTLLAKAAGVRNFKSVPAYLALIRQSARDAFEQIAKDLQK